MSARELGIELEFKGSGLKEIGIVKSINGDKATKVKVGQEIVKVNPKYFRPAEVETLLGDASKAKKLLGWEPEISLQEMCSEMVANDLNIAQKNSLLRDHGYEIAVSKES